MSTIYDEPFEHAAEEYINDVMPKLKPPVLNLPSEGDGLAIRKAKDVAAMLVGSKEAKRPKPFNFDMKAIKDAEVQKHCAVYENAVAEANAKHDAAVKAAVDARAARVEAAESASIASVSNLEKYYDELLTYKDSVKDAVLRYNIKPSDISLDDDGLTRDDMEALILTAIDACKHLGGKSYRTKLATLYKPLADDTKTKAEHVFMVLFGFCALAPVLFVGMFVYMIFNLSTIYRYVDGLRIADKLMYGINFARFRDDPHLEEIPEVDTSKFDQEREERLAALKDVDPDVINNKLNADGAAFLPVMMDKTKELNEKAEAAYSMWCKVVDNYASKVNAMYEEFLANRVDFCDKQSTHYYLDDTAVVGLENEVVEVRETMFDKNLTFATHDRLMATYIRLLMANLLLNVRPGTLDITIYDPDRLGQDYSAFLGEETKNYIHVVTKEFRTVVDKLREFARKNYATLNGKQLVEFNKEAEEKLMVTIPYKLLLVVSSEESDMKGSTIKEFMRTSPQAGVFMWVVTPTAIDGCTMISQPFQGVNNPYPVTDTTISTAISTYVKALGSVKDSGISYVSSFQERYLPREKWWTYNTDDGIDIHIGLANGDPSKGYPITMSDMPVHGLAAGATGAGKSVFINQLLATLITKYPPSTLELILIDFKNAEFPVLKHADTCISRIPHAKILAGTKDGEYIVSVFEYLLSDMEKRNEKFTKYDTKKLSDYNKKVRALGHPEEIIPRTLLLIDEFQVMFTQMDGKTLERIQVLLTNLAKLGRNAGVHMLLTSQSMAGTMSQDVKDQFSFRVALRCSADVSNALIGSPAASTITSKFGFCYSNTNAGAEQKSTTLWRTPFIPDEDWFDTKKREEKIAAGKLPAGSMCIIDEVEKMTAERHEIHRQALFYDSKQRYDESVLRTWLKENESVVKENPGLVVLGERTNFSVKTAPVNFMFRRSDCENMFVYAQDDMDLCNIIRTLYISLSADANNIVLANSADDDYWAMCEVGEMNPAALASKSRPANDPSEWLDFLEDTINGRKKKGMEGKRPVYFLAIRWDKQQRVYLGEDYRTAERWSNILRDGPAVDVHIITFVVMAKSVSNAHMTLANHRICGKGSEDAGYKFIESGNVTKLYDSEDSPIAVYKFGQDTTKFKIYQFNYKTQFSKRELDL